MRSDNGWVSREPTVTDRWCREGLQLWERFEPMDNGKGGTRPMLLAEAGCYGMGNGYWSYLDGSQARHEAAERDRAESLADGRKAIEEARKAKEAK